MTRKGGTNCGELSTPEQGQRALYLNIIQQAAADAVGQTVNGSPAHVPKRYVQSAHDYFRGPVYEKHMDILGLPRDMLPAQLKSKRT